MTTTVLISGANRGIGLGLTKAYAALPDHTVVAVVRNPASMPQVDAAKGSKVIAIKVDASVAEDAATGIKDLQDNYGVKQLDIVIANAGIGETDHAMDAIPFDVFEKHWRVNVLGSLALYQATVPLMPKGAKFAFMSSGSGMLTNPPGFSQVGYGITKNAMSYMARYGHFEKPDLVVFALSPGWIPTDMGTANGKYAGKTELPDKFDDSIKGMIKVIDEATQESRGGTIVRYNGQRMEYGW